MNSRKPVDFHQQYTFGRTPMTDSLWSAGTKSKDEIASLTQVSIGDL